MSTTSHLSTSPTVLLLCLLANPAFAASPTIVDAELWNKPDGAQGVTLSTNQVKPGKILFRVKNISTDEDHELLLVKTDLAPRDCCTPKLY